MTDDENLIKDLFGERDEGDYREISIEATKHISANVSKQSFYESVINAFHVVKELNNA